MNIDLMLTDTITGMAAHVFATVCIFEAMRRLRRSGLGGSVVVLFVLGAAFYGTNAAASWYAHKNVVAIAFPSRPLVVPELPETWGADFSREVRVRNSLQIAQMAFWEHGRMQKHFVEPGKWIRFVPTDDDITRHDQNVAILTESKIRAEQLEWVPTYWVLLALMAGLFGFAFPSVPESANKALQSDVARPAGERRG